MPMNRALQRKLKAESGEVDEKLDASMCWKRRAKLYIKN